MLAIEGVWLVGLLYYATSLANQTVTPLQLALDVLHAAEEEYQHAVHPVLRKSGMDHDTTIILHLRSFIPVNERILREQGNCSFVWITRKAISGLMPLHTEQHTQ